MEFINQIVETTLTSFDITFCVLVNILTYGVIKTVDDFNGDKAVSTRIKRLITILSVIAVSIFYYVMGSDLRLIINSAILAPVSWSWVIKPICEKLGIGYKKDDDYEG